jgi:hypothetical protein
MPALALDGQVGKILVHVQERGARNVAAEIELAALIRLAELPAAVDELVAHGAIVTVEGLGGVYGETSRRLK